MIIDAQNKRLDLALILSNNDQDLIKISTNIDQILLNNDQDLINISANFERMVNKTD